MTWNKFQHIVSQNHQYKKNERRRKIYEGNDKFHKIQFNIIHINVYSDN